MLAKSWPRSPIIFAVVVCALIVSGCATFGSKKKTDTTAYEERPVDQLYAAGAERIDAHRWGESINYFKEVERQHPYSEWSRRAIMMQAYAHYEANQYEEAIADADRFINLYPGQPSTAYAYYLKAECYFEQILDIGRDQAATEESLAAMHEVQRRFPKSEYAADARLKVDMINDQLAGREMTIGRWYLRQGNTLAAIGRFKTVVEKYQTTSQSPEALYRLVEAYLTLGIIDEANRDAAVLGYNYPGDPWYADAYKLMTSKGYHPEVKPTSAGGHGLLQKISHPFGFGAAKAQAPPADVETPAVVNPEGADNAPAPAPAKKKKRGLFGWLPHT